MPTNDRADHAYMAGIIDGEGSITIIKHRERQRDGGRRLRYRLRLYITNQSEALMDWLVIRYGGRVHSVVKQSGTTVHQWCAGDSAVEAILRQVAPFMVVKRPHLAIALEYREGLADRRRTVDEAELARRDSCWRRMSEAVLMGGKSRKGPRRGYLMEQVA